ncbi:MAG TPA: phenylalanine--tRNA ligase subunit alpha [Isosphaeraceae bacterium]|nr:phenylalanine--tRNA ligase subunit alpha [Isosphaeraceae bacterium]
MMQQSASARKPKPPEMSSTDSLAVALADLDVLLAAGLNAFKSAATSEAVEASRIDYLGQKQGRLRAAQDRLKSLEPASRRAYGQQFNAAKAALEAALDAARVRVERRATTPIGLDVTLPGIRPRLGHRHPLTQTADELIDLFGRFGFAVARGPEVEDVHHNFDALNIPPNHFARDPLDNFYLAADGEPSQPEAPATSRSESALSRSGPPTAMLRSQTSTVQIRVMESQPPPVRVIAIGRVYRPDTVDATHSFMFHQIEGLMVDRGVTMAHLKSVLRLFAESYLGREVKIRFRPSFFPFTEPSVEVDMLWHGGERWVEMGGAGMVDPNVLRSVGYDPEDVTGFAFGLGIERLCMRRHGIDDIRLLYQNDVRFLRQF